MLVVRWGERKECFWGWGWADRCSFFNELACGTQVEARSLPSVPSPEGTYNLFVCLPAAHCFSAKYPPGRSLVDDVVGARNKKPGPGLDSF